MPQRFRPRGGFRRRFSPRPSARTDQGLLWAITAGQSKNMPSDVPIREAYVPKHKFADFAIDEGIKRNIAAKNYTETTPIQDQAIEAILEGKDVIGIANTGTGKTAAFLIPLIDKVIKDRTQNVLIITPTRELALQIQDELVLFARGFGIKSALCIGGTSMRRQRTEIAYRPNFVIGTPGRIIDLVRQNCLHLGGFASVVLDETDRMVDIGFIKDIKYLISLLPGRRQSLFFSATVSSKVKEIIQTFVTDPVTISVKVRDTVENISQEIIKVENSKQKVDKLHDLLIQEGFNKVLIFGRTKWGVQRLSDELAGRGFKAGAIHGNKSQSQRQKTLDQFRTNQIHILLATDVASRGLDIEDVSHVINYDMPASYDDYIHRIGRTGRMQKKGTALTFV
ncbi:MAG: DEAD/DEAH box helicase [Candidatus Curtissbacteria bacterium]|nr:DEAD/DEAH box helicase [Candidatus Curtissbacteria bacterium]